MDKKRIYPLAIVGAVIALLEVAMTVLYPQLETAVERIPVLAIIILIPISVVGTFIYLWVKKPGFLYPPSEFSDAPKEHLEQMFCIYCGAPVQKEKCRNDNVCFHCEVKGIGKDK